MSTKTRLADATTLLLLGGGIGASLHTGEWHWFARAGAAVVAIGILLTSNQIREHMQRLRTLRGQLAVQSQRDWAVGEDKRTMMRAAAEQESVWEIEGHGFYMLIAGTLVWGFGDLIGLVG